MQNSGIVRNRLKIQAAIKNAKGYLAIMKGHGSSSDFLWQFVDEAPIQNMWQTMADLGVFRKLNNPSIRKCLKRNPQNSALSS